MPVHATQDFTRQFSPSPEWKLLKQFGPWMIPEAPNTVIVDQIVDLGEWGLVNDQYLVQPDVVFMKAGPGNTWLPTVNSDNAPNPPLPPGWPAGDTYTDGIIALFNPITDAGPGYPAVPGTPVLENDWMRTVGVNGIETGSHHPTNLCRFARLFIARGPKVYTPEEWAIASTRRIHVNLTGPDNLVKEWVLNIPATQGVSLADFTFDLRDYGLAPGREELAMLVEVRRNGVVIRGSTNGATGTVPPYPGEVFDPPSYPVTIKARGMLVTSTSEYESEPNNGFGDGGSTVFGGQERWGTNGVIDDNISVISSFSSCTDALRSLIRVQVWRTADDGRTEYEAVQGQPAIPVPPEMKAGCTLHLKLYRSGRQQQGLHPFLPNGNFPNPWSMQDGLAAVVGRWAAVPATATDPGVAGNYASDGTYLYICVAADTWRRVAIVSW